MLLNPKTPLIVGIIALGALSWYLYVHHPLPDELTRAHQQVITGTDIKSCEQCHSSEGLAAGCLNCHTEIAKQLDSNKGYHAFLSKQDDFDCAICHQEHHGATFTLISNLSWPNRDMNTFNHPHCPYILEGSHDSLACYDCHVDKLNKKYSLSEYPQYPRKVTFLGLTQDCLACHVDVHAWSSSRSCLDCHDQEKFAPASKFEHNDVFALEGAHANVNCIECHPITLGDSNETNKEQRIAGSLPFDKATGETCQECHTSPHRTSWDETCETCHWGRDTEWFHGTRGIDIKTHEETGFSLTGEHMTIDCQECHDTDKDYDQRYPDPKAEGYQRNLQTCQGCHEDVHEGKLTQSCTTCHETKGWHNKDLLFNHNEDTSFVLDEVHKNLSCNDCHTSGDMTFAAKGTECADCHEEQIKFIQGQSQNINTDADPHYNRVACTDCHDMNTSKQSFDSYARKCAACHNDQYVQLAFQWAQTLEKQRNSAELLINNIEGVSKQIQDDLSEAIESGFHNLQLTRQLYNRIMKIVKDQQSGSENLQKEDSIWTGQ